MAQTGPNPYHKRMKPLSIASLAACLALLTAAPASAHHSFSAEFDVNKPVRFSGTVTRIELTNPHAWLYVDVTDTKGTKQSWAVELVGINDLLRLGWGRTRVKPGDTLLVEGYGARNGSNTANAAAVSFAASGELLWASKERRKPDAP